MRLQLLLSLLCLASCGQAIEDEEFANRAEPVQPAATGLVRGAQPVRIGDLGPNFEACAGAGTTRHIAADATLPVRSAPADSASQIGSIAPGKRFFVCTRSHNQKWMGIVYEDAGTLAKSCGVSAPVTSRQVYEGPCRSGWVSSAFVKLIAGVEDPAANQNAVAPVVPAA